MVAARHPVIYMGADHRQPFLGCSFHAFFPGSPLLPDQCINSFPCRYLAELLWLECLLMERRAIPHIVCVQAARQINVSSRLQKCLCHKQRIFSDRKLLIEPNITKKFSLHHPSTAPQAPIFIPECILPQIHPLCFRHFFREGLERDLFFKIIHPHIPADRNRLSALPEGQIQPFHILRSHHIVRIHKAHIFAFCLFQSPVACRGHPAIFLM